MVAEVDVAGLESTLEGELFTSTPKTIDGLDELIRLADENSTSPAWPRGWTPGSIWMATAEDGGGCPRFG